MKRIKTCVIGLLLLLSLPAIAQIANNNSYRIEDKLHPKRLFINDKVDLNAFEWNNVRNYPDGKMKLSDFKGKYIILDFWTKNCTACIAAFPKMEKLQSEFKDEIQILLVTKNTEQELTKLFAISKNLKETKLPIVMGDSILAKELFPHGAVPYHVWLDKNGVVIATTYGEQTNTENLKDLLSGKQLNLIVKNEILDKSLVEEVKNQKLSFFKVGGGIFLPHLKYFSKIPVPRADSSKENLDSSSTFPHYSLFMDFIPGDIMWQDRFFRDSAGTVKGFRIFNRTVDDLYKMAYVADTIFISKTIAEGKAKRLYTPLNNDSTGLTMNKLVSNSYCYESSLPVYNYEDAKALLRKDLSQFLCMEGRVEKRLLPCLSLVRLGTHNDLKLWAKDQTLSIESIYKKKISEGLILKNCAFHSIVTSLEKYNRGENSPLIIDNTGFNPMRKIDVLLKSKSLNAAPGNIENVRKALAEYGLGLKEEMRNFNVLILSSTM